jgi:hypothetical protein
MSWAYLSSPKQLTAPAPILPYFETRGAEAPYESNNGQHLSLAVRYGQTKNSTASAQLTPNHTRSPRPLRTRLVARYFRLVIRHYM